MLEKSTDNKVATTLHQGLQAIRGMRKNRNESQHRFWARFGVTQTSGSRFECGQEIPAPVAILLGLYLDGVISDGDLWRARRKRRQLKSNDAQGK